MLTCTHNHAERSRAQPVVDTTLRSTDVFVFGHKSRLLCKIDSQVECAARTGGPSRLNSLNYMYALRNALCHRNPKAHSRSAVDHTRFLGRLRLFLADHRLTCADGARVLSNRERASAAIAFHLLQLHVGVLCIVIRSRRPECCRHGALTVV